MARLATNAEVLAVEASDGQPVTLEMLALAAARVCLVREEMRQVDDLPEWRMGSDF